MQEHNEMVISATTRPHPKIKFPTASLLKRIVLIQLVGTNMSGKEESNAVDCWRRRLAQRIAW